jgi:hypothetical protein
MQRCRCFNLLRIYHNNSSSTIMVNTSSPSTSSSERKLPNIVITGTPGTGKTSHAQAFLEACPHKFQHLLIGDIVKEKECHEGWNEEWQSYDVDDEKVSLCIFGAWPSGAAAQARATIILPGLATCAKQLLTLSVLCDPASRRFGRSSSVRRKDHRLA